MGNFIFGGGSKSLNKGVLLTYRGRQVLPLSFTLQPQAKTVDEYALATFSCEVTGGVEPYAYQWKKNGTNVGTNSANLSFTAAAADNGASVVVTVTDSAGTSITSTAAVLGVTSYSFRFDGVSQFAKTTSTITLQASQDFEIEIYAHVYENKKRKFFGTDGAAKAGLFGWELDGRFVLRFGNNWILSNSSVSQTVGKHKINLKRISGNYTVSVNDGALIGFPSVYNSIAYIDFIARAFGSSSYEYLDGYCDRFKVWTGGDRNSGALTHHIPLNNKSQGANQLATVGSVNADIFSYNANGWVAI